MVMQDRLELCVGHKFVVVLQSVTPPAATRGQPADHMDSPVMDLDAACSGQG